MSQKKQQEGPSNTKAPPGETRPLKGLDYGCGIGRQTLLLKEFGINAYGIDISIYTINKVR